MSLTSDKNNSDNEELQPHAMPEGNAETQAGIDGVKEVSLRWVLSIVCGLLFFWIIAEVVVLTYHPDVDALKAAAAKLFYDTGIIRPEPVESLLFRLAILVLIPAVIGFYKLFSEVDLRRLSGDLGYRWVSAICMVVIAILLFVDFAAPNPNGRAGSGKMQNFGDTHGLNNFDFYFYDLFTDKYLWAYALIWVPAIAVLFFIGFKKYNLDKKTYFKILTSSTAYAVLAFAIISIVLMNTINSPYTDENKFDFNAVYYSMTQVFAGLPMLVNGFTNTYGLYPHFLNPLFQVTGLSVFTFSLVMSLLLALSFVLNFLFMNKNSVTPTH